MAIGGAAGIIAVGIYFLTRSKEEIEKE